MTAALAQVKLDILSDPVCPWCFIGKALLDKALAAEPDHPFIIEWHPFQLNPDMPTGGIDRRTYLETKFGGKEQAVKLHLQLAEHGRAAGIEFDFGAIQRTPNTLDAHRLIHWAGLEQKQTQIVDALFKAYFQDGQDIGSTEVLVGTAASVGMDAQAIERLLASDNDRETISTRDKHSRTMGVNSVPTFIVANQHVVPGAQQPELWKQVIDDIRTQVNTVDANGQES